MIDFQDVSVAYPNGVRALDGISLSVEKGQFAFIVGATGSGKSTLLKLIYREELPTQGRVFVMGDNVVDMRPSAVPYPYSPPRQEDTPRGQPLMSYRRDKKAYSPSR